MKAYMPHCDQKVLHAPTECEHCDKYPEWQSAREVWGINFTGKRDSEKLPCPSETVREIDVIEMWRGNRAFPGGKP